MTTEIIGPFQQYRASHCGYEVPYISTYPTADGKLHVVVDNRFGTHLPVTKDELDNWMPILANAMAVAAGYSSHGENSVRPNPFKVGMSRIDPPRPHLTVVQPEQSE